MTRRELFFVAVLVAAAVVKGVRVFWDEIDNATSWLAERTDSLDLGWDVPSHVPAEWVSEQ